MTASITSRFRYGVSVLTNVAGGERQLGFADPQFGRRPEGGASFQVNVANDGEVVLTPAVTLDLMDASGRSVGRFEAQPQRWRPGTVGGAVPRREAPYRAGSRTG